MQIKFSNKIISIDYLADIYNLKKFQNKRIGILGGSFNPVHYGHIYIANKSIQTLKLDILFLLVSPCNPLKNKNDIANMQERIENIKIMIKNYPKIKILPIENSFQYNYSYFTLCFISKILNTKNKIFFILGGDNLIAFHRFKHFKKIIEIAQVVFIHRNNILNETNNYFTLWLKNNMIKVKEKIIFLWIPIKKISSTMIRENKNNDTKI
jgi:nicotinate (nicotinamide) nucleotide adenylyltransferase